MDERLRRRAERQAARLNLNRKLALPFANLVLVLAALPFALRFGRTLGVSLGIALIIAVALISFVWTPWDPTLVNAIDRLQGPSAEHLLGTDELGRDVLSRLIYAIRFSVLVALGGTLIGAFIGTTLGLRIMLTGRCQCLTFKLTGLLL